MLREHARSNGGDMLLGIPELAPGTTPRYYNSVMSLGSSASQRYRKHHLVPFGDYFPEWAFITWIMNAMDIPMSSFSRGAAVQAPLAVAGQQVAINICYEDAFGEEIRVEPEVYYDLGEQTICVHSLHGRGQQSGVDVRTQAADLCRWRHGLIVYRKGYVHRADVFRDLGVSEDALEPTQP